MHYNKSDNKVMLAVCCATVIIISIALLFSGNINISFSKDGEPAVSAKSDLPKQSIKQSYAAGQKSYADNSYYDDIKPNQLRLVPFDPNTADAKTLEGLGLARWQVKSILNFRARGGEFRTPEDFARVYKLTANQYKRIRPYIRISSDYLPATRMLIGNEKIVETAEDPYKQYSKISKGEYITLNIADTTDLRKVPGIGPFYAGEIANYGRRLGGYVNVDQLSEITNFPEEAKQYFQIDLSKVKKLNVNRLSLSKLRAHPYINYYQARAIVEYRHKFGNIKSIDELKLDPHITEDFLKKIKPYLEY